MIIPSFAQIWQQIVSTSTNESAQYQSFFVFGSRFILDCKSLSLTLFLDFNWHKNNQMGSQLVLVDFHISPNTVFK